MKDINLSKKLKLLKNDIKYENFWFVNDHKKVFEDTTGQLRS